jgi:DNA-binding MarR family transcriptional regulator
MKKSVVLLVSVIIFPKPFGWVGDQHVLSGVGSSRKSACALARPRLLDVRLSQHESDRSNAQVALAGLLDQVSRHLHSSGHAADLYPAQWSALRYFMKTDPEHRSAIALARYQGIEPGPTTRTVRTLINKGLLMKAGSLGRGRIQRIDVTAAGEALLARDPLNVVAEALAHLNEPQRTALAEALESVLKAMQAKNRPATGALPASSSGGAGQDGLDQARLVEGLDENALSAPDLRQ